MYTLLADEVSKWTELEKDNFERIRLYRHDAAKVYKFSTEAAQHIRKYRASFKQPSEHYLTIFNKKYGIKIKYSPDDMIFRKNALQKYKAQMKLKRKEIRESEQDLSNTGFCRIQRIHLESGGIIKLYHTKLLESPRLPITADRHIGVEIELGFPAKMGYEKLIPFAKSISLAGDGSIHNLPATHIPKEVRILTTEQNYKTELENICKALAEMKAVVNDTCGLHVHLDMRGLPSELITKKFINLVKSQKYLQGMVPEKRRMNQYCKPTRQLNPYTHTGRYKAINGEALYKYQTIEIRLHHGTLNAQEIINWVTLLLDIIEAEEIKRAPPTLKSFMEKIKIKDEIKEYVTKKIESNTPVVVNDEDEVNDLDVTATAERAYAQMQAYSNMQSAEFYGQILGNNVTIQETTNV